MSPEENAAQHPGATSFAGVADVYERSRPSYPTEAVEWLVGPAPAKVLELGAGTGKFTELLLAAGHQVLATEPLPEMLAQLTARLPHAQTAVSGAERIPVPTGSIDVVVVAQAFHWFNHPVALDEIARVLRPGGHLALVWNLRDEGIPWVRKLGRLMNADKHDNHADAVVESELFGDVEEAEFRFWQNLRKDDLLDLVRSRSYVALLDDHRRDEVLANVGALYDDYGRGHDGMQLPYLTTCYRAVVADLPPERWTEERWIEQPDEEPLEDLDLTPGAPEATAPAVALDVDPDATQPVPRLDPPEDTGTILIDFK